MNVDVDSLKSDFLSRVSSRYNENRYFIEICEKFPSKFSKDQQIEDLSLHIFFKENNKTVIDGSMVTYCDKTIKRKVKLYDISNDIYFPELPPVTNYIVEDRWQKTDW
jgi:hypothetical protein